MSDVIVNSGIVVNGEGSGGGGGPVTDVLNIAQGTLVADTPNFITQTWNNVAVAFRAFFITVTNTASGVLARILQLNTGAGEVFSVDVEGRVYLRSFASAAEKSVVINPVTTAAVVYFQKDIDSFGKDLSGTGYRGELTPFTGLVFKLDINNGLRFVTETLPITWAPSNVPDSGLARNGIGQVKVTNGSTGYGDAISQAIQLNPAGTARPTADAAHRGMIWYTPGGAGVADAIEVCVKDAADAYAWESLI